MSRIAKEQGEICRIKELQVTNLLSCNNSQVNLNKLLPGRLNHTLPRTTLAGDFLNVPLQKKLAGQFLPHAWVWYNSYTSFVLYSKVWSILQLYCLWSGWGSMCIIIHTEMKFHRDETEVIRIRPLFAHARALWSFWVALYSWCQGTASWPCLLVGCTLTTMINWRIVSGKGTEQYKSRSG